MDAHENPHSRRTFTKLLHYKYILSHTHIHNHHHIDPPKALNYFEQNRSQHLISELPKMNFRKASTLLIIFFISVAIFSHARVEASRVLSEDFSSAAHLETYSSVYERAKQSMAYWLERLPSGPSPGDRH
jgi:hypothetical protein